MVSTTKKSRAMHASECKKFIKKQVFSLHSPATLLLQSGAQRAELQGFRSLFWVLGISKQSKEKHCLPCQL